jgi:hypothetical protein
MAWEDGNWREPVGQLLFHNSQSLTKTFMCVYSRHLVNATHNTMAMCMYTMLMCIRVTVGYERKARRE